MLFILINVNGIKSSIKKIFNLFQKAKHNYNSMWYKKAYLKQSNSKRLKIKEWAKEFPGKGKQEESSEGYSKKGII